MKFSLLQLPNETLARIAQICQVQDQRCSERLYNLEMYGKNEGITEPWRELKPSLYEFSRTCQKIRDICIPFIFTTIDIDGVADPIFRRRIAPNYARYFHTVSFAGSINWGTEETHEALFVSSGLKGIRRVIIGGRFPSQVCSESATTFSKWLLSDDEAAISLRVLLGRARKLNVTGFLSPVALSSLLAATSDLISLEFAGGTAPGPERAEDPQLRQQRHNLKLLCNLSVDSLMVPFLSALTSPLRSLTIQKDSRLDQISLTFISRFASTLTSLEVEMYGQIDHCPESPPLFASEFPNLRFLYLSNSTTSLLSSSPSLLPSLRTLRIESEQGAIDQIIPPLREYVQQLSSLQIVELAPRLFDRRLAHYTRDQFLDSSFRHQSSGFEDYDEGCSILLLDYKEIQRERKKDISKRYIKERRRPLREVLQFGLEMENAVAKTGDVEKMERLIQAIRPLLMLQEFEED